MRHAYFRLNRIWNVPNNPYYADSRLLKVIIFPPNQIQTILLFGLDVLTTNQEFHFQFSNKQSKLSVVLMETKPYPFDVAYITIPINAFPLNSIAKREFPMELLVSGTEHPQISFDFHISSVLSQKLISPQNYSISFSSQESINTQNMGHFISSDDSTPPIILPHIQPSLIQFSKTNDFPDSVADPESAESSEEEDLIINSRIVFLDPSLMSIPSLKEHRPIENDLQNVPVILSPQQFDQACAIPHTPPTFINKSFS